MQRQAGPDRRSGFLTVPGTARSLPAVARDPTRPARSREGRWPPACGTRGGRARPAGAIFQVLGGTIGGGPQGGADPESRVTGLSRLSQARDWAEPGERRVGCVRGPGWGSETRENSKVVPEAFEGQLKWGGGEPQDRVLGQGVTGGGRG